MGWFSPVRDRLPSSASTGRPQLVQLLAAVEFCPRRYHQFFHRSIAGGDLYRADDGVGGIRVWGLDHRQDLALRRCRARLSVAEDGGAVSWWCAVDRTRSDRRIPRASVRGGQTAALVPHRQRAPGITTQRLSRGAAVPGQSPANGFNWRQIDLLFGQ